MLDDYECTNKIFKAKEKNFNSFLRCKVNFTDEFIVDISSLFPIFKTNRRLNT